MPKELHVSFKAKIGKRIDSNKANSFVFPSVRKVVPYFTN